MDKDEAKMDEYSEMVGNLEAIQSEEMETKPMDKRPKLKCGKGDGKKDGKKDEKTDGKKDGTGNGKGDKSDGKGDKDKPKDTTVKDSTETVKDSTETAKHEPKVANTEDGKTLRALRFLARGDGKDKPAKPKPGTVGDKEDKPRPPKDDNVSGDVSTCC
jgi:hypothetical protein